VSWRRRAIPRRRQGGGDEDLADGDGSVAVFGGEVVGDFGEQAVPPAGAGGEGEAVDVADDLVVVGGGDGLPAGSGHVAGELTPVAVLVEEGRVGVGVDVEVDGDEVIDDRLCCLAVEAVERDVVAHVGNAAV
jgi:hypothetical protein